MDRSLETGVGGPNAGGHPTRRQLLTSAGLGIAATLAGCTVVGEPERRTTTVQHDVTADVETVAIDGDDGETTVEGWDGEYVRIEARKYAIGQADLSDVTVTRSVTGGHLDVGVELGQGLTIGLAGGGLESLAVRVPDGVRVTDLAVDDGDAVVEDVAGDLTLSIDDGTAAIGPLDGTLRVDGDDGEVTAGSVGRLEATLDDGVLTGTEATTLEDVEIDDGDLDLAVDDVVDGTTVSADDGDVTLRLSPSLDLTAVVRADDGSVRFADGVADEIETTESESRARIGDGSRRVTVEVDDGNVSVESLS